MCPLGTLNNMVGAMKRWRLGDPVRGWYSVKYYLLVGVLVASLFSVQVVGVLDPLSLMVRSFSLGIYPAVNNGLNSGSMRSTE